LALNVAAEELSAAAAAPVSPKQAKRMPAASSPEGWPSGRVWMSRRALRLSGGAALAAAQRRSGVTAKL